MPRLTVRINGTGENPWHRMGLTQNPFPQLGKAEWTRAEMMVNSLNGDPVRSAGDIRARLPGFSQEFIDGCIARWRPGERVEFIVEWPDEDYDGPDTVQEKPA